MKLNILKSNKGLYISWFNYWEEKFIYNWKLLQDTFHNKWKLLEWETEILKIEKDWWYTSINKKFILINPEQYPKLEKEYKYEDVFVDGEYTYDFEPMYRLYKYEDEKIKNPNIEIKDFELNYFWEIDIKQNPISFSYDIQSTQRKSDGIRKFTEKEVSYSEYYEMIVPWLELHNYPCSISSKTTFKIIAQYIRDNIDNNFAQISSDYDFCFTVSKKHRLPTPQYLKKEQYKNNWKSYHPPRFLNSKVEYKIFPVFSMTSSENRYNWYEVINWFRWDNLQDLKNNIDRYLSKIIEVINKPIYVCDKCNWLWCIEEGKININNR